MSNIKKSSKTKLEDTQGSLFKAIKLIVYKEQEYETIRYIENKDYKDEQEIMDAVFEAYPNFNDTLHPSELYAEEHYIEIKEIID